MKMTAEGPTYGLVTKDLTIKNVDASKIDFDVDDENLALVPVIRLEEGNQEIERMSDIINILQTQYLLV